MKQHYIYVLVVFYTKILTGLPWRTDRLVSHPYFGQTETQVKIQQGDVAFFHCTVYNVGNQTVSWMRTGDGYPLFIGNEKYINDERFELVTNSKIQYTLKIKFVKKSDAGKFECQVSTSPKISQTFSLEVIVPSVEIQGDVEKHVRSGSPVKLKCVIRNCLSTPTYVFWYKAGSRLIEDLGGRLLVETSVHKGGSSAMSLLTIEAVEPDDGGYYTCRPASGSEATINLHIIRGEKPAAMQHEQSTSSGSQYNTWHHHNGFNSLMFLTYHLYILSHSNN